MQDAAPDEDGKWILSISRVGSEGRLMSLYQIGRNAVNRHVISMLIGALTLRIKTVGGLLMHADLP